MEQQFERVRVLAEVGSAREKVKERQRFIEMRGGNLRGYREHYADGGDGEAFYVANLADLLVAEAEYKWWKSECIRLGYGG